MLPENTKTKMTKKNNNKEPKPKAKQEPIFDEYAYEKKCARDRERAQSTYNVSLQDHHPYCTAQ